MLMRVAPEPAGWGGIHRSLRARGVQGVLLLPQHHPIDLRELLRWDEFSVVSTTASVVAPKVHRVTPHHFANALLLCRELADLGYRRPGLVIHAEHDRRVDHLFDAAFAWHGLREAEQRVPPLVLGEITRDALRKWYDRERPDVVVATEEVLLAKYARWLGLGSRRRVGFASTNVRGGREDGPSGIDERPAEIGAVAVDLLASMIERRVRGLPASPSTTLLPGVWCAGRSVLSALL
jgi:DNA-binding LacI/PurR family transcriptional regulator